MSKDAVTKLQVRPGFQTTQPTPRVLIGPATEPNPPWTNKYFDCDCGAHYQLGCADELEELPIRIDEAMRCFKTPPCWTCGRVNFFSIPSAESAESAVEYQEGNPS